MLTLGQGDVGQLGLGESVMERKKPALVPIPEEVVQAEAGGMHTVCLSKSGQVSVGLAQSRAVPGVCGHGEDLCASYISLWKRGGGHQAGLLPEQQTVRPDLTLMVDFLGAGLLLRLQ